jgi:hypothetical protein
MNKSKDRHMVAYCSSCKEDRGRHTLRGSHSSSHDSRRRYLSDAYLEKRPIFEERVQKHNSRRTDGHRGSMFDVFLALHQIDIPCSKGDRLYNGNKTGGATPRGEWPFSIDVKGGEIIALMYSHGEITQWYSKKYNHIYVIDVD